MSMKKDRKGILLCGGQATRLMPITSKGTLSKQLLPIYDKPMVFYSLSILMNAGIKEIAIISTPEHLFMYKNTFGDGSYLGIKIEYFEQKVAGGIAQAYLITNDFIQGHPSCLVLGDNLMYGENLDELLREANADSACNVFAKKWMTRKDLGSLR